MNAQREHHVAGRAPIWSRWSLAFRHLDGSPCDWRHDKPAWRRPRNLVSRRARFKRWLLGAGAWALYQIHPDPRERRKIYIYLLVMTWLVMCTLGVLAGHGILPR